MTKWIDVPVADVAVGDEVKVDGYGMREDGMVHVIPKTLWVRLIGIRPDDDVTIKDTFLVAAAYRRSSITAARRRKPEPAPKPGDWRCVYHESDQYGYGPKHADDEPHWHLCRVFRASGGWSRDTRTGEPWVMRKGDPVEIVVKSRIGNVLMDLAAAARTDIACGDEPLPDYYRRIGLDVRPVDRRGKR